MKMETMLYMTAAERETVISAVQDVLTHHGGCTMPELMHELRQKDTGMTDVDAAMMEVDISRLMDCSDCPFFNSGPSVHSAGHSVIRLRR